MKVNKVDLAKGIFVTGTDTGVGKTLVSAAIASWCRLHGIDVGVMKPVATGAFFDPRRGSCRNTVSRDAEIIAEASGSDDSMLDINPICFREALSPYTASLRANQTIRLGSIIESFERIRKNHPFVIVEGIGGIMVPISRTTKVSDLIRIMDLPCLIVARSNLGTLNHTFLTVEHALNSGLKIAGVVLNQTEAPGKSPYGKIADKANPDVLKGMLRVPVLGVLNHCSSFTGNRLEPKVLADWIEKGLDKNFLDSIARFAMKEKREK